MILQHKNYNICFYFNFAFYGLKLNVDQITFMYFDKQLRSQ